MKKRIMGHYPLSYSAYWHSKGEYGAKRVERMLKRKQARKDKRKENNRTKNAYCPCCGQWRGDSFCY